MNHLISIFTLSLFLTSFTGALFASHHDLTNSRKEGACFPKQNVLIDGFVDTIDILVHFDRFNDHRDTGKLALLSKTYKELFSANGDIGRLLRQQSHHHVCCANKEYYLEEFLSKRSHMNIQEIVKVKNIDKLMKNQAGQMIPLLLRSIPLQVENLSENVEKYYLDVIDIDQLNRDMAKKLQSHKNPYEKLATYMIFMELWRKIGDRVWSYVSPALQDHIWAPAALEFSQLHKSDEMFELFLDFESCFESEDDRFEIHAELVDSDQWNDLWNQFGLRNTSSIDRILRELEISAIKKREDMTAVLRPCFEYIVMVYHLGALSFMFSSDFVEDFMRGKGSLLTKIEGSISEDKAKEAIEAIESLTCDSKSLIFVKFQDLLIQSAM